jgi:hypothetical protein
LPALFCRRAPGIDDLANLTLLRRHAIVKVIAHISVKGVPVGTKYRGAMSAPKLGACRRGSMQMGCLGYSSLIAWFSFTTAFKSHWSPPLVRLRLQESLHSLRTDSPYTKPALCELMSTSIPSRLGVRRQRMSGGDILLPHRISVAGHDELCLNWSEVLHLMPGRAYHFHGRFS